MLPALQCAISACCFNHLIPLHLISDSFLFYFFFQAVARIGANLCCLYNKVDEQKRFLSVITDAEWGIKLGKLEVSEVNPFHI